MPGTLTTTYGNGANVRQLEFRSVLQIFRHFLCRQHFDGGAFVRALQKFGAQIDFPSENDDCVTSRALHENFLDGKIGEAAEKEKFPWEIFMENGEWRMENGEWEGPRPCGPWWR